MRSPERGVYNPLSYSSKPLTSQGEFSTNDTRGVSNLHDEDEKMIEKAGIKDVNVEQSY